MIKENHCWIFNHQGDAVYLSEADARTELAGKSDFKLRMEVAQGQIKSNQQPAVQAAACSQMEIDRRAAVLEEKLVKRTTYWSATIGAGAVIAGAVLS